MHNSRVLNRGFGGLMATQFFGAVNDNLLKGILSFAVASGGVWSGQLGKGGQSYVALCLTIPFIIFSGIAGQLADRTSKRKLTVIVKFAELLIVAVAMAGFLMGNLWITLVAMVLLAVQSSFFGPAKYGMIPELVDERLLSQANGSINMATNIAVIVGTLLAGPVYSAFQPESLPAGSTLTAAEPQRWVPGGVLVLIAILGFAVCLLVPRLNAMDPKLRISWNVFKTYRSAIVEMSRTSSLLVALAWSFFYLVAWIALLILPDYRELLGVSATKASVLLGIMGIAIGLGSVAAGIISGKHIEPRLIPVGAIGMTVFFALLGLLPLNYILVASLLFGAGVFAGFYIVPLQALLQYLSPADERGRFLGTANAMSFLAGTISSVIFFVARRSLDLPSNRIFLICAILSLLGTGYLLWQMRKLIADPRLRRTEVPTKPN